MSLCPQCGKKLRERQKIFRDGGAAENYRQTFIGYQPAVNYYAPFCSLRCGWRYGRAAHAKKAGT